MHGQTLENRYTKGEEIANAIIHGMGAFLSVVALVFLVLKALRPVPVGSKAVLMTGYIVFGASLIILYLSSTLYHALTHPSAKKVFGILDHGSIYLLIAGTYTAFCLSVLQGPLGWTIFTVIWILAIMGIGFYAVLGSRMRKLSAITYIPLGMIIILWAQPVKASLLAASGKNTSWHLLLAGGACYIGGMVFYAMKKTRWTHPIWHLFVIAGSTLHFFSVYLSI